MCHVLCCTSQLRFAAFFRPCYLLINKEEEHMGKSICLSHLKLNLNYFESKSFIFDTIRFGQVLLNVKKNGIQLFDEMQANQEIYHPRIL